MTKDLYINKSNKVHNNMFIYHIDEHIKLTDKINIECKTHGKFEQLAKNHLYLKHKCPKCSIYSVKSKDEYITKFNTIHKNKYNYSKMIYNKTTDDIIIICPIHGEFKQKLVQHLKYGCQLCSYESNGKSRQIQIKEFISRSINIHCDIYKYNKSILQYPKVLNIECSIHGLFNQLIFDHLSGSGCPSCKSSKGEIFVRNTLLSQNIKFKEQHKFKDCINPNTNRTLIFDFFLPNLNICIEYDGIQHFEEVNFFGGKDALIKQQISDLIKEQFCDNNNIKLIRMNYKGDIK